MTATTQHGAGGICGRHGVYDGYRCPECAKTTALATLRQGLWEADQFLSRAEIETFVKVVMREIEADDA